MENQAGNELGLQEEKGLNIVQRLWGVVFNPGETFRDILARPYWLAVALVAIVVSVITAVLILPHLQAFALWNMERAGVMSPEELAAFERVGVAMTTGVTILGALIGPVLIWLVWTLVLKFYNMFAGNQTPFGQFFAVAVYAYVPVLLGGLVYAAMVMFSPMENFAHVTTSLAALFPGMELGFTYLLLARVDPFMFWTVALLGIGGARAMRVGARGTTVYLLLLWALYALVSAGLGTLGAAFTPGFSG